MIREDTPKKNLPDIINARNIVKLLFMVYFIYGSIFH